MTPAPNIEASFHTAATTIIKSGNLAYAPDRHDLRPLLSVFTSPWMPALGALAEQFFPRFYWVKARPERPGELSVPFLALVADDPAPVIAFLSSDPGPQGMAEIHRDLQKIWALEKRPAWMWLPIMPPEEWHPWRQNVPTFCETDETRAFHKLSWMIRAEPPSPPFINLFEDLVKRHKESGALEFVRLINSPAFSSERDQALRLFAGMNLRRKRGNRETPLYRQHERETKKIKEAERLCALAAKRWRKETPMQPP